MIRAAGVAALALVAGLAAVAKPAADPILGAWAFKTQTYGPACTLEGAMTIEPTRQGGYACRFEAIERCREWTVRATQSCAVTRTTGGGVAIKSTVLRSDGAAYRPDDFRLDTVADDRMSGTMSSYHEAPVVFRRKTALTS